MKRSLVIVILVVLLTCSLITNVFAGGYRNDTIRITGSGTMGIGGDGWLLKNQTDNEYATIQVLKLAPLVGTALSIQEGDWIAVASDAALTLAGPASKASYITFQVIKDGKNAYKAGQVVQKGAAIGKAVSKVSKKIQNGKVVYDSIQVGNNLYKNVVVSSETIRMKKNQIVLKMIAKTYKNTYFVDSRTLKVFKTSKNTWNIGETYATKDGLTWCRDTFSEFVYTGSLESDDMGISEFTYKSLGEL